MHYYQFNIGDYITHTAHLDETEDLAYRRMLDWYYLHESPLPDSVDQIAKFIRMRTHTESIASVLSEFFVLGEYGYHQKKADEQIDAYKTKSDKAKASAAARWAKKPIKRDANALQTDSEGNANHKPLTNNHKPITNNQLKPTVDKSPDWMDEYKTAFWSAYLKKVDKTKTMTLLTKMIKKKPDVEHWQMVLNHIQQKAIVTEKQYWPAPTRFLRDELWQDELPIVGENNGQHKQLNQQSAKPTAAERVRARAELKRAERRNAEPSVGGISADIREQPDNSVGRGNAPSLGNLIERASSKSNLGGLGNT